MRYKILHFLSRGAIGGMERAIYLLLRAFKDNPHFEPAVAIGKAEGYYAEKLKALGVPLIELQRGGSLRSAFASEVLDALRGFHIHHFHDPAPVQIMASLLSGADMKRALTRRGGFIDFRRYGVGKKLKYLLNKILIRCCFHGFSGNTVYATEFVRRFYGIKNRKIHVLYNGIDFNLLRPSSGKESALAALGLPEGEYRVGTACHLRPFKRVDMLIRAFSRCGIGRKRLIVFGRGPELDSLTRLARSLGLGDIVTFPGEVQNMSDYMQVLDCFVLASDSEESFGNALVEAMYLKIPSIVMDDSPALKEHVIDNKTGLVAQGEKNLADKIEYVCRNRASSAKIAEDASSYVSGRYTLDNMVKAYEKFYFSILGEEK